MCAVPSCGPRPPTMAPQPPPVAPASSPDCWFRQQLGETRPAAGGIGGGGPLRDRAGGREPEAAPECRRRCREPPAGDWARHRRAAEGGPLVGVRRVRRSGATDAACGRGNGAADRGALALAGAWAGPARTSGQRRFTAVKTRRAGQPATSCVRRCSRDRADAAGAANPSLDSHGAGGGIGTWCWTHGGRGERAPGDRHGRPPMVGNPAGAECRTPAHRTRRFSPTT